MTAAHAMLRPGKDDLLPVRTMNALQMVRALYEALGRDTQTLLLETLDEAVTWELYAPAVVPFAGARRGRAGVRDFFRSLQVSVEGLRLSMDELVAQGDCVVAVGRISGKARSTGRVFDSPTSQIWNLHEGRVARWRGFLDSAAVAAAFGG